MQFDFIQGETLLINKPLTWTSFDVVNKLRYVIRKSLELKKFKVGHAGTLDPLATGLLILCTGKSTKKIQELQGLDKEYTGVITLGATTPSFDLETEPDATFLLDTITNESIYTIAKQLTGNLEQEPPQFSAKKVNGKRAYEAARIGETVDIKKVSVCVYEFEITAINLPDVHFRIVCSKGTYIRAIARDFGVLLNNGGHLKSLCRTKVGHFSLTDAYKLEEFIGMVGVDGKVEL